MKTFDINNFCIQRGTRSVINNRDWRRLIDYLNSVGGTWYGALGSYYGIKEGYSVSYNSKYYEEDWGDLITLEQFIEWLDNREGKNTKIEVGDLVEFIEDSGPDKIGDIKEVTSISACGKYYRVDGQPHGDNTTTLKLHTKAKDIINKTNNTTMKQQTVTPNQLRELYTQSECSEWRDGIKKLLEENVLLGGSEKINIPSSILERIRLECSSNQKLLLSEMGIKPTEDKLYVTGDKFMTDDRECILIRMASSSAYCLLDLSTGICRLTFKKFSGSGASIPMSFIKTLSSYEVTPINK